MRGNEENMKEGKREEEQGKTRREVKERITGKKREEIRKGDWKGRRKWRSGRKEGRM